MTLQELLQAARATLSRLGNRQLDTASDGDAHRLATGILDMLDVDTVPCGWNPPRVFGIRPTRQNPAGEARVAVALGDEEFVFEPRDLRDMCAMWLRACDEAER